MPAYLVHRIAGEKVIKRLKTAVPEESSFVAGLQGGDLFFSYRYAKPFQRKKISKFGSILHSFKTREFFEKSMHYIKDYAGRDALKLVWYFNGYIVHYCVDKKLHPFVFHRADGVAPHNRLEFTLDSLYVQDEWGMQAADFDISRDLHGNGLSPAIGEWYEAMDKALYGFGIGKETAVRALRDFAKLRKTLAKPGPLFFVIAAAIRLFTATDVRMLLHPKMPSWDYFSQCEYAELKKGLEEAAYEAAEKIAAFMRFLAGEIPVLDVICLFENRNFRGDLIDG